MPIDNKFERVNDPADPTRCQAVGKYGQCPFKAVENCTYCPRHGANKQLESQEKDDLRTYKLALWRKDLDRFSDDPKIKSLREEVGLLRMTLEATVNRCKDAEDLFMYSSKIGDMVLKVEKLVTSCHKLEATTGQLLDRTAALHFAAQVVEIIDGIVKEHVPDTMAAEMIVDLISNQIIQTLATLEVTNKEER